VSFVQLKQLVVDPGEFLNPLELTAKEASQPAVKRFDPGVLPRRAGIHEKGTGAVESAPIPLRTGHPADAEHREGGLGDRGDGVVGQGCSGSLTVTAAAGQLTIKP